MKSNIAYNVYYCDYCRRLYICFPDMKKDKHGKHICNECYHKQKEAKKNHVYSKVQALFQKIKH